MEQRLSPRVPQGRHLHLLVGICGSSNELDHSEIERRGQLILAVGCLHRCRGGRQRRDTLQHLARAHGGTIDDSLVVLLLRLGVLRHRLARGEGVQVLAEEHI